MYDNRLSLTSYCSLSYKIDTNKYRILNILFPLSSSSIPLEVFTAALCYTIVDDTHTLDKLFLHFRCTVNVKLGQKVISYCDEGIFWPALEPVHCTARNETRELERSTSELLSHLQISMACLPLSKMCVMILYSESIV